MALDAAEQTDAADETFVPDATRRRDSLPLQVWFGTAILAAWVLVALFADQLAPFEPNEIAPVDKLLPPSGDHLLGTDTTGRDTFSRLLHGAGLDLRIAFLGALLPAVLGTFIGTLAGFYGKWIDTLLTGAANVLQAFPIYVFLIALVFALGPGERSIIVAFTCISWVVYARIVRAEVLRVRQTDFIAAAKLGGLSNRRIIVRHVMPNSINQVFVYFPSDMVLAMLTLATFSFFGLGVPDPVAEWGSMIRDGRPFVRNQWWLSTAPGLAIASVGIALSSIGDGLDKWSREQ